MPRVVCIHPEPRALERWRRALLEQRHDWTVECHSDPEVATRRLDAAPPDLVVSACTPP